MGVTKQNIKAIIFDCFGVLATDGWLPFKNKYFSGKEDLFREATELNHRVDSGLDNYDFFLNKISELADVNVSETKQAIEGNYPNEELFNYIKKDLKSKYKLGILSNSSANWIKEIFTPEQVHLFDAIALSFEIGETKPASITYKTITDRLGVKAEECIFIDDQERHCAGAKEAGMNAIQYVSVEQLKKDLGAVLN
jgi:HAD superfamily hydrolase (TIGR01549 family)